MRARWRWRPPTGSSPRSPWTRPDPAPCPEAIDAVHAADWLVLGPGSWFTSVIPHLWSRRCARRSSPATPVSSSPSTSTSRQGRPSGSRAADHLAVSRLSTPRTRWHGADARRRAARGEGLADLSHLVRATAPLVVDDVACVSTGRALRPGSGWVAAYARIGPPRDAGAFRPAGSAALTGGKAIGPMAMTASGEGGSRAARSPRPVAARPRSPCRFAGGLHIVSGRIVVEAEFDTGAAAPAAHQHRRGSTGTSPTS